MSKKTKEENRKAKEKELNAEKKLIKRIQKGDTEAFDELIRENYSKLKSYCFKICGGNEVEAGDVLQAATIKSWNKIDQFEMNCSFHTWFYRIAYNLNCDMHRAKQRHKHFSFDYDPIENHSGQAPGVNRMDLSEKDGLSGRFFNSYNIEENNNFKLPDEKMPNHDIMEKEDVEFAKKVSSKVLKKLTKTHREVLRMRELKGMAYAEIAKKLNISVGTVMSRLYYARKNALKVYKVVEKSV